MNRDYDNLLRRTLRANGFFSGLSGLVGLAGSAWLAGFMGLPSGADVLPTAASLLLFSGWLLWMSSRRQVPRGQAATAAAMDWLWVAVSVPLVLGAVPLLTDGGRWLLGIIGLIVADFAAIQTWALVGLSRRRDMAGM